MVILGIDPGSRITGFGVIHKINNQKTQHLENGGIYLTDEPSFEKRLVILFDNLQKLIETHRPDAVAVENIFYSKNVQSALKLGHARGVALVCAAKASLPVFEYTPLQVKQAVAGFGGAPKDQVQKMVKVLLNLPEIAEENASDALAVAICHAHTTRCLSA